MTVIGDGIPKEAAIQSGVKPVLPHAPYNLALSNIEAFSVVLQFTPGFDGNSSISKWTVQVCKNTFNKMVIIYICLKIFLFRLKLLVIQVG